MWSLHPAVRSTHGVCLRFVNSTAPTLRLVFVLQVNFDAERFVDYILRADNYQQSIKNKLAQAGVKGRPSAAALPWFDLQGSPLDFDLKKALKGQPVNADTLEQLGQQVCCNLHTLAC